MARYKTIDLSPRFLAVDLEKQLLPVSFSHAVHHLLEHDFDLSGFATRYRNDETGASAYPPGMLPKVILCAYAEGVVSSRASNACAANTSPSLLSRATAPRTTPRLPPLFPDWATRWPRSLPRCFTSATGKA